MPIPISSSAFPLDAAVFLQEGFELSLNSIVPSIELTGSFTPFASKTEFYIYDSSKNIIHTSLDYQAVGSYLHPEEGTSTSLNASSSYNQFEYNPAEDVYNQGFSYGTFYAIYNFIDYELGSEIKELPSISADPLEPIQYDGHPYFIKDISGDRTELRIQNNFLSETQIENYYNQFINKLNSRNDADEFYISFGENKNFIAVNSELELPTSGSSTATSILIKLYKPLLPTYEVEQQITIFSKVAETQAYEIKFSPNLQFIDNLLSLKGPNYNIDLKDRVNNSTNFKNLNDLINANSSQSYFQFNSLQDEKGVILRKDYSDWNQFIKYSSAEQRLNNFYDKMVSIEAYEAEILNLNTISSGTQLTDTFSSSYSAVNNNINDIISKFDSYEYFLYYITGSNSWPKYDSTYPYPNYSVSSSVIKNWFGSTDEISAYYNSGKNQIYSASRYDNDNQDYLYYVIPPFITENSNNNQYIKFVNMVGQAFDEMYLYTEAIEQVRNTNSQLTGSVLPLQLADEVIESFGFNTYANSFNSIGFNPNTIGTFPAAGSGEEYITRYIDITSGSIINYYDQNQTTLGYIINLADPAFPYPIDNAAQEIYKRIFHNMISLVKRKGTVTGLRQLINIWGVPNTMLRISEFGGKNKNDENDYDLWMNRYSNAYSTFKNNITASSTVLPSSSVRIPWSSLTSNYYADSNAYAVPDCIQFRFKAQQPNTATANFSQSLFIKTTDALDGGDFGVTLTYSGSQSGSYLGAATPTDYQYGTLQLIMSGSTAQGGLGNGYFLSDKITLPFFDNGWWSVQVQRKNHAIATDNSSINEFELKVANNIYEGYDGNQIGFQGSASIIMPDGKLTSSLNEAWNDYKLIATSEVFAQLGTGLNLGGLMRTTIDPAIGAPPSYFIGAANSIFPAPFPTSYGFNAGSGFLGQFQEFRYYRRALSGSQFNDYVMNPESIQGHGDSNTGLGSSYDLLSFRIPLGNELEYTEPNGTASFRTGVINGEQQDILSFGGQNAFFGVEAFGSLHPSLVNKKGTLYTSSFIFPGNNNTSSYYALAFRGGPYNSDISSSYLVPNTEINYMDQPSAGIRNRIKNKIQVIDGNEYGTTLSPFRSIQQEFEQSSSYTEDLNSLEVGFSFQNEINDDIIATFGHGVVSDAIADPRFISESSDRYPELTRIAEDYFKKYQGITIDDPTYTGTPTLVEQEFNYNRLIQFYETSLFKAIKNYVPARTSLSTGIIVKQHLLERNKTQAITSVSTNTLMAKTPETGSDVYGYTTQTGYNSVFSQRNLLISSSIAVGSLTGSAGGSVNKYNTLSDSGSYFAFFQVDDVTYTTTKTNIIPTNVVGGYTIQNEDISLTDGEGGITIPTLSTTKTIITNLLIRNHTIASSPSPNTFTYEVTSDKRGVISSKTVTSANSANLFTYLPQFTFYPGEQLTITAQTATGFVTSTSFTIALGNFSEGNVDRTLSPTDNINNFTGNGFDLMQHLPSSQQVNWYRDNYTGLLKVKDTQEEFYNGEYSGSNIPTIPDQYNPYRIAYDGTDLNPDSIPFSGSLPVLGLSTGPYNVTRFPNVTSTEALAVPIRATASLVTPSGSSANGVYGDPSSDVIYIGTGVLQSGDPDGASGSLGLEDFLGGKRQFLNFMSPQTGYSADANGKWMIGADNSWNFGNISSSTVHGLCNISTNFPPFGSGTATLTLTGLTSGKEITAQVGLGGFPVVGWGDDIKITDWNPNNDNATVWINPTETFTGTAASVVYTVTFNFTAYNAWTAGVDSLFKIQICNDGNAANKAQFLNDAIVAPDAFGGMISASIDLTTYSGTLPNVRLYQTFPTSAGNKLIDSYNNFAGAGGVDGFAKSSFGTGTGEYAFPDRFVGGVSQPSPAGDTIYLQNAITDLIPGTTYTIEFSTRDVSNDGFGMSSNNIGLSTLGTPGGLPNGVPATFQGSTGTTYSGTWTQTNGTTAMFFADFGTYGEIDSIVINTPKDKLAPKHFYSRDAFTIMPTASVLFENSIYNPIINNVTESRGNSFLFDQDFDPPTPSFIEGALPRNEGIPSDYSLLVSSSQLGFEGTETTDDNLLEYAEVPDSNYTTTAIINPRYVGSNIFSADYNFYTGIPSESLAIGKVDNSGGGITGLANPPFLLTQNKVQYINGETGSWTGDISYGKTAVIDRNPINIAHFKQAYQNPSVFNTTTFVIDQLIQIPFTEILSEQSPIITSSLINGSNENLIPISSTFTPGRNTAFLFNNPYKTFSEFDVTLNYNSLGIGSKPIFAAATDFKTYQSNQPNEVSTIKQIIVRRPAWVNTDNPSDTYVINTTNGVGAIYNAANSYYYPNPVPLRSRINGLPGGVDSGLFTNAPSASQRFTPRATGGHISQSVINTLTTGSSINASKKGLGILNLRGCTNPLLINEPFTVTGGGNSKIEFKLLGPYLAMMNTININTQKGNYFPPEGDPNHLPQLQLPITTAGFGSLNYNFSGSNTGNPYTGTYFGSIPFIQQSTGLKIPNSSPTSGRLNLPLITDKTNPNNYFRINLSSSNLPTYEPSLDERFILERGDEIRISYLFPSQIANGLSSGPYDNVIEQDFKVIGYEMAPPTIQLDTRTIPSSGDFYLTASLLITSSKSFYKDHPMQIYEYYNRITVASENSSSFFLMNGDSLNATVDGMGSGSFIKGAKLNNYVINLLGENNPTTVDIEIDGDKLRLPNDLTPSSNIKNWVLGTNNNGSNPSILYPRGKNVANIDWTNGLYIYSSEAAVSPSNTLEYPIWIPFDPGFVFDRLLVFPDPSTLSQPIPSGSILSTTFRKRVEDDTKVMLNINLPSGSMGFQTPSGDGYLIPDDLTNIQQRNVQKVINKLKSENVFTQDSSDNLNN